MDFKHLIQKKSLWLLDNLGLSTGLIMYIGYCKEIPKMTF